MARDYRRINFQVMTDTVSRIFSTHELSDAVKKSVQSQFMVSEDEAIDVPVAKECNTRFICSGKRSFEAAKGYPGKRVAVLNFANNHSIGGAPFSAGAQEESLCRCSTLYPCLQAMKEPFYKKHQNDYMSGKLSKMGNDDLIYTPDVIVFKTDERTDPIIPEMLPREKWYKVNIITCAAPENRRRASLPTNYEQIITSRIKKILDIAAREGNEVLILGAWGCGAFGNPIDVVARVFCTLLRNYDFESVEFALSSGDGSDSAFARELGKGKEDFPQLQP